MTTRPILTLAHSPDPDDAFMWWPITGKVSPSLPPSPSRGAGEMSSLRDREGLGGPGVRAEEALTTATIAPSNLFPPLLSPPVLDTGRFQYRAYPADIEALNRRAADSSSPLFDITALSFRAYCDVKDRYAITTCGSSFGEGFGPKVVARRDQTRARVHIGCEGCLSKPGVRIAIPGRRTTAFLVLGMILGREIVANSERFVEMPFERIIPAVARGEVEAGLVIHEGQVLFEQAGLKLVVDVGDWWKEKTGLPLPLGANAIRRDLDARFGVGTLREVTRTLHASINYALEHRSESLQYTMPFALANTDRSGRESGEPPTLERVDRYVDMYVNRWTVDMGEAGAAAVSRLLREGHAMGLCPDPGAIDVVGI